MSFEGLIERMRLDRLPDDTHCIAVIITGSMRYEQDQYSLRTSVRTVFPEFGAADRELMEWSDRVMGA
jgi:hypothetical protein